MGPGWAIWPSHTFCLDPHGRKQGKDRVCGLPGYKVASGFNSILGSVEAAYWFWDVVIHGWKGAGGLAGNCICQKEEGLLPFQICLHTWWSLTTPVYVANWFTKHEMGFLQGVSVMSLIVLIFFSFFIINRNSLKTVKRIEV